MQGCAFPDCDRLMAGVETDGWRGDGTVDPCTAAFYVGSPVDDRPFMLSAGHCIQPGRRWDACIPGGGCGPAGTEISAYYGGGGDAGVRRVDFWTGNGWSPGWNMYEGWVNWWNHGVSTVRAWLDGAASVGSWVCHQGLFSRSACGHVTYSARDVDYYVRGTNPPQFDRTVGAMIWVADTCAGPGDSGGPVTMRDQEWAVGIFSGAQQFAGDECNDIGFVEPVHRALQTLNVHIYGRP
jgi:hypothetical protein